MARIKMAAAALCVVLMAAGLGLALWYSLASQWPERGRAAVAAERRPRPVDLADAPPRLIASWKEKDARVEVFSPDALYVVSSGGEGCRLRDTGTGRVRAVLTTSPHQLHGALFSPDGRFLFAKVSSDRYKPVGVFDLKVWVVASGALYATFPYISEGINVYTNDFALSGNGRTLAFLDNSERLPMKVETSKATIIDGGGPHEIDSVYNASPGLPRVKVWDVPHWKETAQLDGGSPLVFSPDGKTLITGARDWKDTVAKVWDVGTGRLRAELDSGAPWVTPLTFSPDGKYLAIGVPQKQVLYELASGRKWSVAVRGLGNDAPRFSSDGRLLFPIGMANSERLPFPNGIQSMAPQDARSRGYSCYDLTTLPPKGLELEPAALIVAPDGGRYAAVLSRGGMWGSSSVVLHDLPSSRETGRIEMAGLIGAAFSPDGRWLALLAGRDPVTPFGFETRYDLELRLLDPTSARVRVTNPSPGQTWGNSGWKFSPDGKYLAINYRTEIDDARPGDPNPSDIMKLDIWEIPPR